MARTIKNFALDNQVRVHVNLQGRVHFIKPVKGWNGEDEQALQALGRSYAHRAVEKGFNPRKIVMAKANVTVTVNRPTGGWVMA